MTSNWDKKRLGELISVKGGLSYKGEFLGQGDGLLLGMGCVSFSERILTSGARLYGGPCAETHLVLPGDLVLATRQQSDNMPILGFPAMVPESYRDKKVIVATNLYKVTNNSSLSNRFLYWLLKGPEYKRHIVSCSKGTTVRMITKDAVESFEFNCPSEGERNQITDVLDALDKKIQINRALNNTLEQMAQAIFKSWFVDFDPVKAKMNGDQPEGMDNTTASLFPEKLVESELGTVPEGWPVGKLSELIKFANGKSGKKSDNGQYPLYGANGIIGFSDEAKFEDAVIIGRVGAYCGAIEYCNSKFWASDNTIIATAKGGKTQLPFVLYLLKFLDLNQHAGGAAQPLLNQKVLNSLEVPIPSDSLLEKYGNLLSKMLDKMMANIEENESLESLRDTLLPKLLSGEIELDIAEVNLND